MDVSVTTAISKASSKSRISVTIPDIRDECSVIVSRVVNDICSIPDRISERRLNADNTKSVRDNLLALECKLERVVGSRERQLLSALDYIKSYTRAIGQRMEQHEQRDPDAPSVDLIQANLDTLSGMLDDLTTLAVGVGSARLTRKLTIITRRRLESSSPADVEDGDVNEPKKKYIVARKTTVIITRTPENRTSDPDDSGFVTNTGDVSVGSCSANDTSVDTNPLWRSDPFLCPLFPLVFCGGLLFVFLSILPPFGCEFFSNLIINILWPFLALRHYGIPPT